MHTLYANKMSTDYPVHQLSLISAFVVCICSFKWFYNLVYILKPGKYSYWNKLIMAARQVGP